MQIYALLELVTGRFKNPKPKQKENLEISDMTPEEDAWNIWEKAFFDGKDKYIKGSQEHKTQFWTAGAGWYAKNLKDEQLDLISYLHHLIDRIKLVQLLADMMEQEEISMSHAARLLKNLVSDNPPEAIQKQSHD